jgi:O-antigen/teichoic acid export membrane protein
MSSAPHGAGVGPASRASTDRHIVAVARGSGFLAGGSLFELGSRFVIALLLARGLGATDYGMYVLAITASALISGLALIGLDDAMVRYVAILSGRRDDAGVWGTIQVGVGTSTLTGIATGGILFVLAEPIATSVFREPGLTSLLRIVAVLVPFLTLSNVLAGVTRGFERMDYVALAENVVMSLVRLAGLGLLVLIDALSVQNALILFGVSDVAATLCLAAMLRRCLPRTGSLRDGRRDTREVFRFALPLWMSGLIRQFRRNIETIMLGALTTVASVGVFAVAVNINFVGHLTLLSLLVAIKPILAQLHDRGDRSGLSSLYTTSTRWSFALNLPFFLVIVLYAEALLNVFGESFTSGAVALTIISVAELVNAATGTCGSMLDMTGHTRLKLLNSLVWTVMLIGGGALLIPTWGVNGAAVSTLIAVGGVNLLTVVEVWVLERLTPFDRTFWKPLAAGAAAALCGLGLRAAVPVGDSFLIAAVQGAIVFAVYVGLLFSFGLAPQDRLVLDGIVRKLRRPFRRGVLAPTVGRHG